jgi:hypothetical protein
LGQRSERNCDHDQHKPMQKSGHGILQTDRGGYRKSGVITKTVKEKLTLG